MAGDAGGRSGLCGLGLLRLAGLTEARARTFVGEAQAPLTPPVRAALAALVEMGWPGGKAGLITEDAAKFRRLCDPESAESIVECPDCRAWIPDTLLWGRVGEGSGSAYWAAPACDFRAAGALGECLQAWAERDRPASGPCRIRNPQHAEWADFAGRAPPG